MALLSRSHTPKLIGFSSEYLIRWIGPEILIKSTWYFKWSSHFCTKLKKKTQKTEKRAIVLGDTFGDLGSWLGSWKKLEKAFEALQWKIFSMWKKMRPYQSCVLKQKEQKCSMCYYISLGDCFKHCCLMMTHFFCLAQMQSQHPSGYSYIGIRHPLSERDRWGKVLCFCAR